MSYIIVTCNVCGIENATAESRIEKFVFQLRNERWTVSDNGKIATCPQCKGLCVSERKIVVNFVIARTHEEALALATTNQIRIGYETFQEAKTALSGQRLQDHWDIYAVNHSVVKLTVIDNT